MTSRYADGFWLGVGLSAEAEAGEAIKLAETVIGQSAVDPGQLQQIATIAARRDHAVLSALSTRFHVPVAFFDAAALEAETPRLKNPSDALFARIGCHGVAEAAALAAAGPGAELIVEKTTGRHVTVAVAAVPQIR
jgi:cobalt-precorrin 5A hydrolase/precorrin-3B C17-methyltransferase